MLTKPLRVAPASVFTSLCLLTGAHLSCANSPTPFQATSDAGHSDKADATRNGLCGALGQGCCAPPTQCDVGGFCAPDGTCKNQHPADIGRACSSPSSCSSGICGYTQGIMDGAAPVPDGNGTPSPQATGCTVGCYATSPDCTPGWTCQQLSVAEGLCVCTWSPEVCDGLDNNCDGIIDNEPEVDNYCTQMDYGIPQKCVHGSCACVDSCHEHCVDIQADVENCGKCDHSCAADVEKCVGGECTCAYTVCDGTHCTNTAGSDNANCGGCGVPCAYQCAAGTCGPAVFASGLTTPGSIAVDGTNVYWLDRGTGHTAVQYCPLGGCTGGKPATLAVSSGASSYPGELGALLVTSSSVYFADDGGRIEVTPIAGGTGTASVFSSSGDTEDSYLAGSISSVYWANSGRKTVDGCALGPSCATSTSIADLSKKEGTPRGVAVSGSTVYWGSVTSYPSSVSIQSAPVAGGTVTMLCSATGSSTIEDLLLVGDYVYFTNPGSGVHVCALATPGVAATTFYADKKAPSGLATDGTDLYFTEDKDEGAILKCPLGATCSSPTTLASGVKDPHGIAVSATEVYVTSPGSVLVFHK